MRLRTSTVIIHDNKILGFHAKDPTNGKMYFFLPGGLIEPNEHPEDAAIRETFEETGYQIALVPGKSFHNQYEFLWDGKLRPCETHYFRGVLLSETPAIVSDAAYHKGVAWLPIQDLEKIFSYHEAILEAVRALAI